MIIAGAGSAGKETLGLLLGVNKNAEVIFFDENASLKLVFDKYPVINNIEQLKVQLAKNPSFCVAIGHPRKRQKMFEKITDMGGRSLNIYAPNYSGISHFADNGSIFQPGVVISYEVEVGKSCLIHANTVIGHKVQIGDFVNISPLCSVIGPSKIGHNTHIGSGSIILPGVSLGCNVIIKAGSIVDRDIKDYETF